MSNNLLLEAQDLDQLLQQNDQSLIVDVTEAKSYCQYHIPGALYFDYPHLVSGLPPAPGKLPSLDKLKQVLAEHGIHSSKTIIAYDHEGGGKASRLLWTLDLLGFQNLHLINGGLVAWVESDLKLESEANFAGATAPESLNYDSDKFADKEFILNHLGNDEIVIWDARTPEEYYGQKPRALRNGHIPGAVNLNWLDTIDRHHALRYLPKPQLIELLTEKGITADKIVIPHCQTHHRSAHSAMLLKHLGFPRVKAYPGSWSEWGNLADTPIET